MLIVVAQFITKITTLLQVYEQHPFMQMEKYQVMTIIWNLTNKIIDHIPPINNNNKMLLCGGYYILRQKDTMLSFEIPSFELVYEPTKIGNLDNC